MYTFPYATGSSLQTETLSMPASFILKNKKAAAKITQRVRFSTSVWQCFCAYVCGCLVWLLEGRQLVWRSLGPDSFLVGEKEERTYPIQSQGLWYSACRVTVCVQQKRRRNVPCYRVGILPRREIVIHLKELFLTYQGSALYSHLFWAIPLLFRDVIFFSATSFADDLRSMNCKSCSEVHISQVFFSLPSLLSITRSTTSTTTVVTRLFMNPPP